MEFDLGKLQNTTHIEFYGVPGCGKTTISHQVSERLRECGVNVREPNYEIVHNYGAIGRRIVKLFSTFVYGFLHLSQLPRIIGIVSENGYKRNSDIFAQIVNIVQKLRIYNKDNKPAIYIWDQGITQAAISLSVTAVKRSSENERAILSLCYQSPIIHKFFVYVDRERLIERIGKRSTNNSRIEKTNSNEEMINMLHMFEIACNDISDYSYSIDNTPNDIDYIVDVVINKIQSLLTEQNVSHLE